MPRGGRRNAQEMIKEVIPDAYTVSLKKDDDDKAFSNSAILKFKSHRNNVAVKIFSNGMLHITGPVSAVEVLEVRSSRLAAIQCLSHVGPQCIAQVM